MARISVLSGKRGRPLSIDPEKELQDLVVSQIPKAKQILKRFREETHGIRDESLFGSETTLPDFITSSLDILADLKENSSIDYESLKELKSNLKTIRQLSSKQERVYGRALDAAMLAQYESGLKLTESNGNEFVIKSNKRVMENLRKMMPLQRKKFFMSKTYQDPKTMVGKYQNIITWAEKRHGRQLDEQEAWAILREARLSNSESWSENQESHVNN